MCSCGPLEDHDSLEDILYKSNLDLNGGEVMVDVNRQSKTVSSVADSTVLNILPINNAFMNQHHAKDYNHKMLLVEYEMKWGGKSQVKDLIIT